MNEFATQLSVPRDHPSLAGHFPGNPIVPGVVLLDLVLSAIRAQSVQPVTLQSIVSTKFLQAVAPETPVDVRVILTPADHTNTIRARFVASTAATPVLEGSFMLSLASSAESGS